MNACSAGTERRRCHLRHATNKAPRQRVLQAGDDGGAMGVTRPPANWPYTYVKGIRHFHGANWALAAADTSAHELGHQFEIDPTEAAHNGMPAHDDSDDCVMSYSAGSEDGVAEFCADIPATPEADDGCIYDVRKAADGR